VPEENKNNLKEAISNRLDFPPDFFWGAGTSAYQVEGGIKNDWSEYEEKNAERLAKEAVYKWEKRQQEKFPEIFKKENYTAGINADHYNRFKEDFEIAKNLGHNAHRFSIEWARVEPEDGKFDEKAIAHYQLVINELLKKGIEPFVTLWHFSSPLWIRDAGGWANSETVEKFERYVEKITGSLKGVKYWITINEPTIYIGLGHVKANQPPAEKNYLKAIRVYFNLLKAHKLAYKKINNVLKNTQVGFATSAIFFQPKNNSIISRLIAGCADYFWNYFQIEKTRNCCDFIGVNYYTRKLAGLGENFETSLEKSDLNWEIYPEGIYAISKKLNDKYKLPIFITENGIATTDDALRAKFIKSHLAELSKAIKDGVYIRGYFYWSFLDIYEMVEMRGFWTKFGLVDIDYETKERKIRDSAWEYKKIIEGKA
jgi:beta-glucosidase